MIRRLAGAALFVMAGVVTIGVVPTAEQPSPAAHVEYRVQLRGPVLDSWKAELAANGADLLEYLPAFAFRVRVSPADAARVRQLPFVESLTPYDPANKLARRLARNGRRPYLVRLERDANALEVEAALASAGIQVAQRAATLLTIVATGPQLDAVARLAGVASVERYIPRGKHNEFGGGVILGSNVANANGFDGSTQTIGVADTGIGAGTAASAHADIPAGRVSSLFNWPGTPDFCFEMIVNDGAADVDSGHGTHVATAALGAGNALGVGRGTAPAAALVFQALENYAVPSLLCSLIYGLPEGYYLVGIPADIGEVFQQAYTAGARIHSDSWGSEAYGEYTADSENADRFVWNHRDMAVTFSAGNSGVDLDGDGVVDEGSLNSPATAKNVISVGASENDRQSHWECDPTLGYTACAAQGGQNQIFSYGDSWPERYPSNPLKDDPSAGNADQMAAFSSRGPTTDGRIKPDVVAPGTWTLSGYSDRFQQQYDPSPNPQTGLFQYDGWGFPIDASYKYMGGTSMAAPLVAGGAAVVRDFYQKTLAHPASAALVKATLINSAVDLLDENNDGLFDNAFPIPNIHEGWGRVDLVNATDGSHQFDDETSPLSTGSNATFTFPITTPGQPFKVTLVWTDYPSSPAAAVNLVNDLDLTVVAPDGTTYAGNAFAGGWSVPATAPDRLNNVENVYVFAAASGTWTVTVNGYNVPQGPQPFALVMDAVAGDGSSLPKVRASVADGTATEAGPSSGAITLTRSGDPASALTVSYTVGGTATAGADYTALSGTVTIPEGASDVTLPIDPLDDAASEPVESVVITVQATADYGIGSPSSATVTITSDDLPPDLSVSAMTAPATAAAGSPVIVTDTTRNVGTAPAPPSETGFYLSSNSSWDSGDLFLGSRSVSALAIGGTEPATTTIDIPVSVVAGSYYVLAKADWQGAIGETSESNNVRPSAAVRIGPDLIVSVMTGPATAAAGEPIAVSDTTKNQGAGASLASSTAFYLSTNTTWDAADVLLGARAVSPLVSGATEAAPTSLVIPSSTAVGSYYVIAKADADAVVAESLETNNVRASAVIRIGADLTVSALTVPAEAGAGDAIVITETTRNTGGGDAPPSSTAFYLSVNTTLDASDTSLGSFPVPFLEAGAFADATVPLTIPAGTAPGTYRLIAKADGPGEITETTETNNTRASATFRVGPDLLVSVFTAPATAGAGVTVSVTDTAANQGGGSAAESLTEFYLSANAAWDTGDTLLGSRSVPTLAPGGTNVVTTLLTIPGSTAIGSWYIVAKADASNSVAEALETNNVKASAVIKVGPDLTVSALTGPTSAVRGTTIAMTATTRNAGGGSAGSSTTSFYLSINNALDATDLLLGSSSVPALAGDGSDSTPTSLTIPTTVATGSYYVIAKADAPGVVAETSETNNTRTKSLRIDP
jgi:serine protease AprX